MSNVVNITRAQEHSEEEQWSDGGYKCECECGQALYISHRDYWNLLMIPRQRGEERYGIRRFCEPKKLTDRPILQTERFTIYAPATNPQRAATSVQHETETTTV